MMRKKKTNTAKRIILTESTFRRRIDWHRFTYGSHSTHLKHKLWPVAELKCNQNEYKIHLKFKSNSYSN